MTRLLRWLAAPLAALALVACIPTNAERNELASAGCRYYGFRFDWGGLYCDRDLSPRPTASERAACERWLRQWADGRWEPDRAFTDGDFYRACLGV